MTLSQMALSQVTIYRSKERDRKSELVLRSTYQIFEWDRNNSDRNFYNVVRYVHKVRGIKSNEIDLREGAKLRSK